MTIPASKLNTQIQTKLATSPTGSELCALQTANTLFSTAAIFSVASVSALPSAADNKGRLIFVEDISSYRYSNGVDWVNDYDTTLVAQVYTWGEGSSGILGNGSQIGRCSPGTTAGGGTNWCQVSTLMATGSGIKLDGTLWTWGIAGDGQLGDGSTASKSSPVETAGGGTTWCCISMGGYNASAIKTDGTLWTWGRNGDGQLGTGNQIARCSPGTTVGCGTTWCISSTGQNHMSAVKTDGTLWSWGLNSSGQVGDGTTINKSSPITTAGGGTDWCFVKAGWQMTLAIKTNGTLWSWGQNNGSKLGEGTQIDRSSPGTTAGGGTNWCQATTGYVASAGIKTDGTLWTWGQNVCGVTAAGTVIGGRSSPSTVVGEGTTWCMVEHGCRHMAGVKIDGTLWSWGHNNCGQLGDGTTIDRSSPGTTVGGITDWFTVATGCTSTIGLRWNQVGFDEPLV